MYKKKSYTFKPRLLLIGIICLLLFLIVSSILFFVPSLKGSGNPSSHRSSLHSGQTATPDVATTTLTPISSLTPTPLFFDDFIENSGQNDTSGYLRTMVNNQLVLSGTNHKILIESLPTNTTFSDFSLTVTFTLLKGDENDSVGFYLRGDSNLDHDYRIDIFGNNRLAINKELLNPDKTARTDILVSPTPSPLLKPKNQANTLTVMMKGPFMILAINGTIAASVIDVDYARGQIALFVNHGPTSSEVSASFSSVRVDPAPDQLPGFPAYPTPTLTPQN
jgi:3-keto-disaccharide hydrolase